MTRLIRENGIDYEITETRLTSREDVPVVSSTRLIEGKLYTVESVGDKSTYIESRTEICYKQGKSGAPTRGNRIGEVEIREFYTKANVYWIPVTLDMLNNNGD